VVNFGEVLDLLWIDPDDPAYAEDCAVIAAMVCRRTADAAERASGRESAHPAPPRLRLVEPSAGSGERRERAGPGTA
jgi:hypothetical protein